MCTVSFIPVNNRILLTSNRDEQTLRAPALHPVAYNHASGKIFYPRDGQAGGTWIAMHSNGNAMVLLNGAFEPHIPQPPYRKSRGLIFLEVFDSADPLSQYEVLNLDGIEPFTLVIYAQRRLWETRWDGQHKHIAVMAADQPHIWSSATLYSPQVIRKREAWFEEWLNSTTDYTATAIRRFHEFGGEGNPANDLIMHRGKLLQTISITGMELGAGRSVMHYKDIITGRQSISQWIFAGHPHAAV